jgi:hypothetical protein
MASSIGIELGAAGGGTGSRNHSSSSGNAHGSHSHSKKRASRSHVSSGGVQVMAAGGAHERSGSASLSRVRVHVSGSPDEEQSPQLSIEIGSGGDDEERKSPMMPALGSAVSGGSSARGSAANLATPTGAVAGFAEEEDDSEASGALKADSDRSRKAVALLRELDSWLLPEDVVTNERLSKATRQFYAAQNELVEGYKGIVRLEEAETAAEKEAADAATEKQSGLVKFAIEASLANTFLLIVMKFVAAIWSGSISIIASAVDSALDVLSQSTLVVTSRFMHRKDPVRFPIGKSRVENLAVLVFSVIMGLAALFLLYQSLLVLVDGLQNPPEIRVDAVTTSILGASIVIQIFAHFFCKWVASKGGKGSTAVQAVAEDHGTHALHRRTHTHTLSRQAMRSIATAVAQGWARGAHCYPICFIRASCPPCSFSYPASLPCVRPLVLQPTTCALIVSPWPPP